MRLLSALILTLVDTRFFREVFLGVELHNRIACAVNRLLRKIRAVGTHVGDETCFVELLGHSHGVFGREIELARGFLLQGRRGERRLRLACVLALRDARDLEVLVLEAFREGLCELLFNQKNVAPVVELSCELIEVF